MIYDNLLFRECYLWLCWILLRRWGPHLKAKLGCSCQQVQNCICTLIRAVMLDVVNDLLFSFAIPRSAVECGVLWYSVRVHKCRSYVFRGKRVHFHGIKMASGETLLAKCLDTSIFVHCIGSLLGNTWGRKVYIVGVNEQKQHLLQRTDFSSFLPHKNKTRRATTVIFFTSFSSSSDRHERQKMSLLHS